MPYNCVHWHIGNATCSLIRELLHSFPKEIFTLLAVTSQSFLPQLLATTHVVSVFAFSYLGIL